VTRTRPERRDCALWRRSIAALGVRGLKQPLRDFPSGVLRDAACDQVGSMTASDIPLKNIENLSERARPPLLAERGLVTAELVERFRLGYANSTLTYRLPKKHAVAGCVVREQLQRLGVMRATGSTNRHI